MRTRRALGVAAGLAGALLLLGPPGWAFGDDPGSCTSLSVVAVESPAQLADMSEYLVTATLTGEPAKFALKDWDDMRYWVGDARITRVFAQRPDAATQLTAGQSVPIGTSLLHPRGRCGAENAAVYPTEGDRPHAGDTIVAFLTGTGLAGFGPGFAASGQALLTPDGTVTVRGVPGPLNHRRLPLAAVTTAVQDRYSRPAPWRQ